MHRKIEKIKCLRDKISTVDKLAFDGFLGMLVAFVIGFYLGFVVFAVTEGGIHLGFEKFREDVAKLIYGICFYIFAIDFLYTLMIKGSYLVPYKRNGPDIVSSLHLFFIIVYKYTLRITDEYFIIKYMDRDFGQIARIRYLLL